MRTRKVCNCILTEVAVLFDCAQVGQSFAAGLDSAMGTCISRLPSGSNTSQCCGVVQQVRDAVVLGAEPQQNFPHAYQVCSVHACKTNTHVLISPSCALRCCFPAVQTLQNANSLSGQAGTSSVFSTALASYPRVQACQQSS